MIVLIAFEFYEKYKFYTKKDKDIWINNTFNDFFRIEFFGIL